MKKKCWGYAVLGQFATFSVSTSFDASILKVTIPPFALPPGVHDLEVQVVSDLGLVLSDKATYTVIATTIAPGPPPFGWPCVEPILQCD